MKYIKVLMYNEYSVFEVIEEYEKTIKCKLNNCENGYIVIGKNNVLKQAATIEELCDEFVVKHINNEKPYITDNYQKHDLLKDRQKAYEYGVEIVYGAIWTTKGLIYVAKMDDEGKLVLI